MLERKLLCDDYRVRVIDRVQLDESAVASVPINGVKPRILGRVTGVFQNFTDLNENRRRYPKSIWESHLSEGHEFRNRLKERAVLGVLEHPEDGITRISEVSHVCTDLHFCNESERAADPTLREGDMIGTYEVLDTTKGRDLWALHEAKVDFGVSSRGLGSTVDRQGESIVQDDYVCETFDVVFNPSVKRARPRVNEGSQPSPAPAPAAPTPAPAPVVESGPPAKVNPPSNTPSKMTPREKLRSIKAEAIQLTATSRKGLKVSDRGALIERAENLLISATGILQEDASLKPLQESIASGLNKFITEMDDDTFPGDEPPAPPAAEPAPPAAPPAEGAPEGEATSEEVQATLDGAAAKLRELGGEDPAVTELAADLEDLAVAVGAETEDVGIPEEELAPLPESVRRKVKTVSRRYAVLESQHKRLTKAAGQLLERHTKARKSLRESSEYKTAARDLATKYNKDMIATNVSLIKVRRPGLYESNQAELDAIKIFEKWETRVCELVEAADKANGKPAAPAAPAPPAKPAPVTESQATPAAKPGAPAPAPAPVVESTPAAPAPAETLAESHDTLRMVLGQRRK